MASLVGCITAATCAAWTVQGGCWPRGTNALICTLCVYLQVHRQVNSQKTSENFETNHEPLSFRTHRDGTGDGKLSGQKTKLLNDSSNSGAESDDSSDEGSTIKSGASDIQKNSIHSLHSFNSGMHHNAFTNHHFANPLNQFNGLGAGLSGLNGFNGLNSLSSLGYHSSQSLANQQHSTNSSTLHQPLPIHSSAVAHHSALASNSSTPCTVNNSSNTNSLSANLSNVTADALHSPQSAFSAAHSAAGQSSTDSLIQNYKASDSIRAAAQTAAIVAASNLTHNPFVHAQYNSLSNNSLTGSPFNPTHLDAQLAASTLSSTLTSMAAAMSNNSINNAAASNTNNLYSNFAKFAAVVTQNSHLGSNNSSLNNSSLSANSNSHSTNSIVSQLSADQFSDIKPPLVMPTAHPNPYAHHLNENNHEDY